MMPDGGYWGDNLTQAVTNGSVSETRLNDMVTRILAAWYLLGQDEGFPEHTVHNYDVQSPIVDVRGDHGKLIREIGAAGTVLVKNVQGALPLQKPRFLNIYGYDAKAADSPWTTPARYGGGYDVVSMPGKYGREAILMSLVYRTLAGTLSMALWSQQAAVAPTLPAISSVPSTPSSAESSKTTEW